jgi:iron complex outermembrane recepter protein
VNVLDLDFQHHLKAGTRNDIVWGGGYRFTTDAIDTRSGIQGQYSVISLFNPPAKSFSLFSAFAQDEISLSDSLSFTVGSKIEHNAFTGVEIEPAARINWVVNDKQTVWAALSQAIRQPSRVDTGITETGSLIGAPGIKVAETLLGNPALQTERLRTAEVGYKFVPQEKLSVDATAFYGSYYHLVSVDLDPPTAQFTPQGAVFDIPFTYGNSGHARTYGTEVVVNWIASQRWRLAGSYSWLDLHTTYSDPNSIPNYRPSPGGTVFDLLDKNLYPNIIRVVPRFIPAVDPTLWSNNHKVAVQSYWNVTPKITFDTSLYQVSALNKINVPAYTRLDARLGWKLTRSLEASITGQNLLTPRHLEFGAANLVAPAPVSRSVFGRLEVRF